MLVPSIQIDADVLYTVVTRLGRGTETEEVVTGTLLVDNVDGEERSKLARAEDEPETLTRAEAFTFCWK